MLRSSPNIGPPSRTSRRRRSMPTRTRRSPRCGRATSPTSWVPAAYEFPRWQEAGLIQPIDISKLKNWNKIAPTLRSCPTSKRRDGRVWFVPHYWGNTSVTFRTDLAPEYVGRESLGDPVRSEIQGPRRGAGRRRRHRSLHRAHDRHRCLQHERRRTGRRCRPSSGSWSARCASSPATTRRWRKGSRQASSSPR